MESAMGEQLFAKQHEADAEIRAYEYLMHVIKAHVPLDVREQICLALAKNSDVGPDSISAKLIAFQTLLTTPVMPHEMDEWISKKQLDLLDAETA